MKINELINAIGTLQNNDNTQTFDLKTKEGYDAFKKVIKELRDSDMSLFDTFGIDIDEWLDNVETLGKNIYESNKENKDKKTIVKDAVKQMNRKVVDHSEEDDDKENTNSEPAFKRPSELLSINQKLQLHKLVQEYVDTTIKPFNKGVLTNNQINDAYAGLYEFGAWILNR